MLVSYPFLIRGVIKKKFLLFFIVPLFLSSAVNQVEPGEKKFLILTNPNYDPGLFSVFATLLGVLDVYDEQSKNYSGIKINFNTGRYVEESVGPNWWEYFFEPLVIGEDNLSNPEYISDREKADLAWRVVGGRGNQGKKMARKRGHELIQKYVRIKPAIQELVDAFSAKRFFDDFIIGVHFRGTDKVILEASRVDYERVESAILEAMAKYVGQEKTCQLFIATDERDFLDYIKQRFSTVPIIYIDCPRSSTYEPLHVGKFYSSNYQKGKDAVLDCLLLSKCHVMIRTSSNLSLFAEFFNPEIPVIFLE